MLADGVKALKESRFVYTPPPASWKRTLLTAWVKRDTYGKRLGIALAGLIAVLGVTDAIRAAQIETALDFNYTPYVVAGALFCCLTIPMARLTDRYARKKGYHVAGGHL